jgi:hypothetical protein
MMCPQPAGTGVFTGSGRRTTMGGGETRGERDPESSARNARSHRRGERRIQKAAGTATLSTWPSMPLVVSLVTT